MKWRCFLVFLFCLQTSSEVWVTWNEGSNSSTIWNDDVFLSFSLVCSLPVKFELHEMTMSSCLQATSEVWVTWNDGLHSSTTWNDDVFLSSSLVCRHLMKFELHEMTVQIALLHEMMMFSCLPLLSAGYQWSLSYMKWWCLLVFLSCLQATSEAWVTWNDGLNRNCCQRSPCTISANHSFSSSLMLYLIIIVQSHTN